VVQGIDCGSLEPALDVVRDELGPVVAAKMLRSATHREQVLQRQHHVSRRERSSHFGCQALSREFVQDSEDLQLPTVLRTFRQEVIRPHVVAASRSITHTALTALTRQTPPLTLFPGHLHVFLFPQPMDSPKANGPS